MRHRHRFSEQAFTLAVARTSARPGAKSLAGARLVLVYGRTLAEAGREVGCSAQAVSQAARGIVRAALGDGICPTCGRVM